MTNADILVECLQKLQTKDGAFPPPQEALEAIYSCLTNMLVVMLDHEYRLEP